MRVLSGVKEGIVITLILAGLKAWFCLCLKRTMGRVVKLFCGKNMAVETGPCAKTVIRQGVAIPPQSGIQKDPIKLVWDCLLSAS